MAELEMHDAGQCLSEHPWFDACCLNPATLQTAYRQYRSQHGPNAVEGSADQ